MIKTLYKKSVFLIIFLASFSLKSQNFVKLGDDILSKKVAAALTSVLPAQVNTKMVSDLGDTVIKKPVMDLIFIPVTAAIPQSILVVEKGDTLVFLHLFMGVKKEPTVIASIDWFSIYKTNKFNPAINDKTCTPTLPYALNSKNCLKLAITTFLLKFRGLVSLDINLYPKGTYILDHKMSFISEENLPQLFLNIEEAIAELQQF